MTYQWSNLLIGRWWVGRWSLIDSRRGRRSHMESYGRRGGPKFFIARYSLNKI